MSIDLLDKKDWEKFKKDKERFQDNYIKIMGLDLEIPTGIDIDRLKHFSNIMRGYIFAAVEAGQSGHPGGSSGKVEQLLAMVLSENMAFDPMNPKNPGRDRLVWSAGHCTPGIYSINCLIYEVLRRTGQSFSEEAKHAVLPEQLIRFRHSDGPQGHAESYYPLVDFSTGPSGHGLSSAGGMAIAHKSCGLPTKVFVMMGDAESEEGMTYEARNVLVATATDNIIVSLDYNHFGIDGPIEEALNSPYLNHWRGMGWNVIEVDGHNVLELIYAYRLARANVFDNHRPTVVISHTYKGRLYGTKENTAASHGSPVKHEEYVEIMKQLGFDIPGIAGEAIKDIEVISQQISKDDEKYILEKLEWGKQKIQTESNLVKEMVTAIPTRPFV
ncbi:MAG: hypothetical protein ACD_72C00263G0001, partial [uncultured bacterium]